MKKIVASTLVIAALSTSAQAEFSFSGLFKDISDVMSSLTEDRESSEETTQKSNTEAVAVNQTLSQQEAATAK